MHRRFLLSIFCFMVTSVSAQQLSNRFTEQPDSIATHKVVLDNQNKLVSWISPQPSLAYARMLQLRWNFIKTRVPMSPGPAPRSNFPQYYFYCSYIVKDGVIQPQPDNWMNDIAERMPNWFESARLYYAFSGDDSVMSIVRKLANYNLEHGTTPASFDWPNFPYTTTNAGDTEFKGFSNHKRFVLHEVQVDHAGDMGLTYFRLYQFTGEEKYRTAAINIANTLAKKARTGTATQSVWPYRVVTDSGRVTSEYGANWMGCYALLESLVHANLGNTAAYKSAMVKTRDFVLQFPMKTGYWTDGHTDTDVNSNTYKSNMSASNTKLYIFDHPEFTDNWKADIPRLMKWTEDYFVARTVPGEPSTQWGANIVGEQDDFLPKMDYQTARYAAECARWYAISGDESYKEKAYRSMNWVTYCNDENGLVFESPVSKNVLSWWSDCYGEGPRMVYHAFAAIPEWAPAGENHILYSAGILKNVSYQDQQLQYTAADSNGKEFLRLHFKPTFVSVKGKSIPLINNPAYGIRELGNGDYAVLISRKTAGKVIILAK